MEWHKKFFSLFWEHVGLHFLCQLKGYSHYTLKQTFALLTYIARNELQFIELLQ